MASLETTSWSISVGAGVGVAAGFFVLLELCVLKRRKHTNRLGAAGYRSSDTGVARMTSPSTADTMDTCYSGVSAFQDTSNAASDTADSQSDTPNTDTSDGHPKHNHSARSHIDIRKLFTKFDEVLTTTKCARTQVFKLPLAK
ncbi:hypothetical protein RvY_11900 [Ramazzottius varieornatus]|uniref:Uncharacterized protein n=1 Tax=Ramazzottius varieornatus TaxID=947166 RepID=A0A1D1VHL8_RAMVA|nr:hypothetical protein RvY_11900 [Ramazzottius varieornatus]